MTEEQVVALMESSSSSQEWNTNAKKVKVAFGGSYPGFWYSAIISSGVAETTMNKFGGTAIIRLGR